MSPEPLLLWGFGLFAAAVVLVFIEVMIPSGGVIGLIAGVVALVGVVNFFRVSVVWGMSSLLALLVLAPLTISYALKVWPHTPIGRRMILGSDVEDEEAEAERRKERQEEEAKRKALIGARGAALTDLRPVGTVRIENRRYEANAEGGMIEAGATVRVTDVQGNRLKVRRSV